MSNRDFDIRIVAGRDQGFAVFVGDDMVACCTGLHDLQRWLDRRGPQDPVQNTMDDEPPPRMLRAPDAQAASDASSKRGVVAFVFGGGQK